MLIASEISRNNDALIEKNKKQSEEIIDRISKNSSESLVQIRDWVSNPPQSLSDISILARIVDVIHFYFFIMKHNKEERKLIKRCLCKLIKNWRDLSEKEISGLIIAIKKNEISNDDVKSELKKFASKRTINFDEDGIGYDVSSPYLYLKEIERLAKISLKLEPSPRMMFKEEWIRLSKIDIDETIQLEKLEKKIAEKEFELFASQEEKETKIDNEKIKLQAKQRHIEKSIKNTKNIRENLRINQKKTAKVSKLLDPVVAFIQQQIDQYKENSNNNQLILKPSFEGMKEGHDLLTNFLKIIDYEKFKELINFSRNVLGAINKLKETLNKIEFSKRLKISLNYNERLDDLYKQIEENFNRDIIFCLEYSLNLFKQCINEFFKQNEGTMLFNKKCLQNKNNLLNKFFSFLLGKYYFLSKNRKNKFVEKFFFNIRNHPDFGSIKNKIDKLKWWHFILMGISPSHIFKKNFKECLSKKLFLDLIEEEFKNSKNNDKESQIKHMNVLYSIQDRLEASNLGYKRQLNIPRSRQEIIDSLNRNEEIKDLLDKISILEKNATWCVNEFSNLLAACHCQRESKQESKNVAYRKLFFSNLNPNDSSTSSVSRGLN